MRLDHHAAIRPAPRSTRRWYGGATADEFGMGADIDDPPRVHDHDPIGDFERVQLVGDEEDGAALHELAQDLVDVGLADRVDGTGEFIEDQDASGREGSLAPARSSASRRPRSSRRHRPSAIRSHRV